MHSVSAGATASGSTEKELHIFRRELLHGDLVIVDGATDHVGLLLL